MRELYGSRKPIRSKPALQKADTLWKTAYHSPRAGPSSGMKRMASSSAPAPSIRAAPPRM